MAELGEAGTAALKTVQAAAFRLTREEIKQRLLNEISPPPAATA